MVHTTQRDPEQRDAGLEIASPAEAASRHRLLPASRYDLIIIGGGSAGLSAATLAATLGAHTALLDREKLGGECLYTGCVASKALLQVARIAAYTRAASRFGLSARLDPVDLDAVAAYVQQAIAAVYTESDAPEHYRARGVDVAFGDMRFVARNQLEINGQTVMAKRFLICTGSHPAVPPIPGLAESGYLTNETIFALRRLPQRLVVIGGGPIGCELGQAFARLGTQVIMLEAQDRLLPRDEPEAARVVRDRLEAEGVVIHTQAKVSGVERNGDQAHHKVVRATTPGGERVFTAEELLVAVGRAPNVAGLGLEAAGVRADPKRGIAVDRSLRTSNPRVSAAGDVTGGYLFTHAAALQARTAVRNALIPFRTRLDERVMPWTTFTDPEIAHVGLTEAEARARHGAAVRVVVQPLRGVDRAVAEHETAGFVKLVATRRGQLLGATIAGPAAGEYINELALALQEKLGLAALAGTTHVYPTLALAIQQAAGQYSLERVARSRLVRFLRGLAR